MFEVLYKGNHQSCVNVLYWFQQAELNKQLATDKRTLEEKEQIIKVGCLYVYVFMSMY